MDSLEVSTLSFDDRLEGHVISIRSGEVRRQAPLLEGRTFRFPASKSSRLMVEVLRPLASCYVMLKPGADRYQAVLECNDIAGETPTFEFEVKRKGMGGGVSAAMMQVMNPQLMTDAEYIHKHGLVDFWKATVGAILKETDQIEDPFVEVARHFMNGYDSVEECAEARQQLPNVALDNRHSDPNFHWQPQKDVVELVNLSYDDRLEGCLLSMRAGESRRQAPIGLDVPFSFPSTGRVMRVKVELLKPVFTATVVVRPGGLHYCTTFRAVDNRQAGLVSSMDPIEEEPVTCDFLVKRCKAAAGDAPPPCLDVSAEVDPEVAREYLRKHDLVAFYQRALDAVLAEKPQDPYAALARRFLMGHRSIGKCNSAQHAAVRQPPLLNFEHRMEYPQARVADIDNAVHTPPAAKLPKAKGVKSKDDAMSPEKLSKAAAEGGYNMKPPVKKSSGAAGASPASRPKSADQNPKEAELMRRVIAKKLQECDAVNNRKALCQLLTFLNPQLQGKAVEDAVAAAGVPESGEIDFEKFVSWALA
eukprot:TRINITY_DN30270_c0_g1_i1.p1 TRINITY_DN30270_c0_g1~~TRINITY_DN30270_c0_g1_i1.p1  ORF type:complete len:531 (+),score=150.31 TRINITY_DN30270_c0_g1_i1:140-1732(+)